MSTSRVNLHTGAYEVGVAEDGALVDLRQAGSDRIVLTRVGLRAMTDGRAVGWDESTVRTDEDETELIARSGDLGADLRHGFAVGWTTRLVLTNTGGRPYALDDVVVEVRPGDAVTGWQLSGGSGAWFAYLTPAGPVLAGHAATGWIASMDADGLHLGPVVLAPAERRILRLVWDWSDHPAALRRRLPDWLPARTLTTVDTDLALPGDPDSALWLGDDGAEDRVWIEESATDRTMVRGVPGRTSVELRSARRTTVLELGWAPSPAAILADAVRDVLARPRTRAGLAGLRGIDEALTLQRVLVGGAGSDREDLADALDLFTARETDPSAAADPWQCSFAVGEAVRQADEERLAAARGEHARLVAAAVRAQRLPAGLGLATIRLSLALMVTGADFRGTVDAVTELVAGPDLRRDLAWWEARLATTAEPGDGGDLVALGRRLGTMLPGRAAAAEDPVALGQCLAVLRLLPDALSGILTADWGLAPAELVERATVELCLELRGRPVGPAHRWLAVFE